MITGIHLILPIPSKYLNPNNAPHTEGAAKRFERIKQAAVAEAWAETKRVLAANQEKAPRWADATLEAVFYYKTAARRDKDNCAASLKAYQDGIAEAGIVTNDSVITPLPVVIKKDKDNPRVEITIKKQKEQTADG